MPFDNFYEESDKACRRWWKCFGAAFLLFIGYWTFALLILPNEIREDVAAPEFPLPAKERQERVHELCDSLPVPEGFQFTGKSNTTDVADFSSVSYIYQSMRSKDEIYPTFLVWFSNNGWTVEKQFETNLKFRKNNQSVVIAPFAAMQFDYFMINCTEGKSD